jgi:hypothetical protein
MQVKNISDLDKEIPEVGFVDAGDVIEVPDDLGASLVEQVDAWVEVKSKGRKATDEENS